MPTPNGNTNRLSALDKVRLDSSALWSSTNNNTAYAAFRKRYWDDPVAFARDCIQWDRDEGPTAYQNDILYHLAKDKRVCVRSLHGAGKCLEEDELVRLANGALIPARDLVGKAFDVLSVNASLEIQEAEAYAWDNGTKDVVQITTDRGRTIKRTLNHPLWADNTPRRYSGRLRPTGDWIEAGDLVIGSVIASVSHAHDQDYAISDEEVSLMAYLIGDGGLTNGTPMFTKQEGKQVDEVRLLSAHFGCELRKGAGKYGYSIANVSGGRHNPVMLMVRKWGIDTLAKNKSLPDFVFRLSRRQVAIFLSRLFGTDGWATVSESNGKTASHIGFASASQALLNQIHCLLLRMGVEATVRHRVVAGKFDSWELSIRTTEDKLRFAETIGIYGKEDALALVVEHAQNASKKEQQRWRLHNLPDNMRWETVVAIAMIKGQRTVGISVPVNNTFLTDFVEHNSMTSAIAVIWFALTRDGEDWKIPTTASAWRQLEKFLWPEIHKWLRRVNWERVGRPALNNEEELTLSLRLGTGEAFALASDDHNMIEGAHADHMLYVFDEAKAIPEPTWDAAEGAMVSDNAMWLAVSTPGPPVGRFFDIQSRRPGYSDWFTRHVKLAEAILAGRVTKAWAEARSTQWGDQSSIFKNRVLGEFAAVDVDAVIPIQWIERANDIYARWLELYGEDTEYEPIQVGIDVARMGADKTVFAYRYHLGDGAQVIGKIEKFSKADTMATAGQAMNLLANTNATSVLIDAIGIGAGVYDRCMEIYPYRTYAFIAGEGTTETDLSGLWSFADKRSAAWWRLRELLDPANGNEIGLPPDDELSGDLASPTWRVLSNGRIRVESKDSIRERLHRSTDTGDSVVQAFATLESGGMEWA